MADIARIEERLDRVAMGGTAVSDSLGGIVFQNMTEVIEFSKLMSLSGNAVPKHLQGNPGMCLAVCVQAMEWRFSPFAVANKSYEVQNRLSFESQLVHAVIEQRAPIIGRLRHRFEGEGDARVCIVWAKLRETGEDLEYRSPPFSKIQPKNSPLWKTKPDLQQYYNTSRDFCRAYFPDVLLGVYSEDELRDHVGPDNAKDITAKPDVASRLKGSKGRGFNHPHVDRESRGGVIETEAQASTSAVGRPDEGVPNGPAPDDGHSVAAVESNLTATNSDSSEPPLAPQATAQADAPAASEAPASAAGQQSEPSTAPSLDVDEGDGDGGGNDPFPSLPDGTLILYAASLRRAQKKESLAKYAKVFWESHGGWEKWQRTPDGETAAAIFSVFRDHFGNKDQIELQLRELI